ncbi:MAG: TerC family protein [Abditibacteriaceae bacterium]
MIDPVILKWGIFNLFIVLLLVFDLAFLNRKSHEVSLKEALGWSAFWITLALLFGGGIWYYVDHAKALEFFTGYVIEYSLSVDNIFVFILIFGTFSVAPQHRHKVLFWGILGALVMRGLMIVVGVSLIQRFGWIVYIFGAFLIFTGIRMLFQDEDDQVDPDKNPSVRLLRRIMPVTKEYHGGNFFVHLDGKRWATPLLVVLLVIETTDLIFATDSIPAILAISRDPFIVYTSNVFAILGLRSLYFAVAGVMDLFCYLKYVLSMILAFVGIKMLLSHSAFKIPTAWALLIIVALLAGAIIASLLWPVPSETESEEKEVD